jgi:hypothetical protein
MGIKQPFNPQALGDTGLPISDYDWYSGGIDIPIKDWCSLSVKVLLWSSVSPSSTTRMVSRLGTSGIPKLYLTFTRLIPDGPMSSCRSWRTTKSNLALWKMIVYQEPLRTLHAGSAHMNDNHSRNTIPWTRMFSSSVRTIICCARGNARVSQVGARSYP